MDQLYTVQEVDKIAIQLLEAGKGRPIWAFYAPMGAGKTTLITSLCKALGVMDHVSSPTFSIMNEYATSHKVICHMDWYRLADEGEAIRAGVAASMDEADLCFIEWPERAPGILPPDTLQIQITIEGPAQRRIRIL
jgi:tRNA threonylcarbamoyladenosine biosynthesis protein TsaE